jgi:hypothetical protein
MINAYDLRDPVIGVKGTRDDDCNRKNWENTEIHEAITHVTFDTPACYV